MEKIMHVEFWSRFYHFYDNNVIEETLLDLLYLSVSVILFNDVFCSLDLSFHFVTFFLFTMKHTGPPYNSHVE